MFLIYLIPAIVIYITRKLIRGQIDPFKKEGDFIYALYLISISIGVALYFAKENELATFNPNIASMLYLGIALSAYLLPMFFIQNKNYIQIDLGNLLFIRSISIIFTIGSSYSLVYYIIKSISSGLMIASSFSSDIAQFRHSLVAEETFVGSEGVLGVIATAFSTFFGVSQILGIIIINYKIFKEYSRIIGFTLILTSTSYIFNALVYAGRDGFVFWVFSIIFIMISSNRMLGIKPILNRRSIFIISIILLAPVILISLNRFDSDAIFSILYYFGQQVINFNDIFELNPPIYFGTQNFNGVIKLTGIIDSFPPQNSYQNEYIKYGVQPWVFKFFIGSLYTDFGIFLTLPLISAFSMFLYFMFFKKSRTTNNQKTIYLPLILAHYLYAQIGFMGVFYFKHSSLNNYLIAYILLILLTYTINIFTIKTHRKIINLPRI